ncbi:uncharacterized protein L3040_008453 [Drepanopeziza brunnea f. sp. 'multigermtubi']|uniref:Phosphatidylethanolamine-binding protein PEBP n=1 Tax=Marssonina brunnea f. sp. multigermtubi (strain MB_m1) TaxID=1072389 RepID=K1X6S4_MARBU|nr:uncharacterized protein MBM_05647 [Drepanopeziza brunnea f. sp. 'multigermtubi' MB_m1]EKD16353.1 hypothetical protein MBM_05647 [Drepanopeziza brunnea f. sp. 'multigermtubi' MB_m1]KAJ5033335.1 hypothetical protein L3040_008453 [Drepanopeziza brunnea f. sp. 'multigermtubi']
MLSQILIAVALAGAATAVTPPGFQPASTTDLVVAFGNTLAVNGKLLTKAETAMQPTIATMQPLTGTYAIMMVDPDIPPQQAGGPTGELLHWMQQDMTSANTSTMIGDMMVYVLQSSVDNTAAIAPYFGPSPPNKAPNTHRYTQLLLDTTNNPTGLASLTQAGATRTNFDAVKVVNAAGVKVVAGNSFNVMNVTDGAAPESGNTASVNTTTSTNGKPAPVAAAPANSATLQAANITKVTGTPQLPGAAMPSGGATSNGVPTTSTGGTTGTTVNGTSGAQGVRGAGRDGMEAYFAVVLALTAALFLL